MCLASSVFVLLLYLGCFLCVKMFVVANGVWWKEETTTGKEGQREELTPPLPMILVLFKERRTPTGLLQTFCKKR